MNGVLSLTDLLNIANLLLTCKNDGTEVQSSEFQHFHNVTETFYIKVKLSKYLCILKKVFLTLRGIEKYFSQG